jgi:DNA modification methylase
MTYKALILASAIEVTGQRRNANMIDLKFKLLDWIIWIKPVDRLLFSERHEISCRVYVFWYMAIVIRRVIR